MNRMILWVAMLLLAGAGCKSKSETVTQGREAVKDVVTQPFNTLESAKDSLKQSEEKTKAALEEAEKAGQ